MLTNEIEVVLSPEGEAAITRTMAAKRQNGSPTARHFASRKRRHNPTPSEVPLWCGRPDWWDRPPPEIKFTKSLKQVREEIDAAVAAQRALAVTAKAEWQAFNDQATQEQVDAWNAKYGMIYIPQISELQPVTIVPFPKASAAPQPDLLKSSGEFVAAYEPPDFLIDGILQRRYFYSLTAATGSGKTAIAMRVMGHVTAGRPLNGAAVEQGTTLYFAGENPTDVQARWLGLTRDMGISPDTTAVHFLVGAMDLNQTAERITAEVIRKGLSLALVIVDTAAAYSSSEDENSNTQAGAYARQLRSLTQLPGGPTVIVLCHPTKRAGDDDLIPRGGGAFLAEVDGNIAVQRRDSLLALSAQGKFRGPEFPAMHFELETVRDHPRLKDTKGRTIPTVIARPVGGDRANVVEKGADHDNERVLRAVSDRQGSSPTDLARALGWTYGTAMAPNQTKVARALKRLLKEKLVVERLGAWRTTQTGDRELNAIDAKRATMPTPPIPLPRG
ncbi:AAA family ATPase [Bradyrhizobium sp. USDA 329]|uniref:AAA family ATPase n=1 Tax=unclassified Bradyrhizobium TaxID=2631580 RepID=UPI003512FDF3